MKNDPTLSHERQALLHLGCAFIALSRSLWARIFFMTFISILIVSALAGCGAGRLTAAKIPSAAPVIAAQVGKDAVILSEADKIDGIAPAAKPHTDAQRAAVAAAPAQDVGKLVAEFEAALKNREGVIVKLTSDLVKAKDATDRWIRGGGYALAALLVSAGAASFFLAAQVPFLGPKIGFALIAAGASVFGMMQAYDFTRSHPWITAVSGALILIAGALAYANHHHAKTAP